MNFQIKIVIIKNDLARTSSAGGNGVGVQGLRSEVRVFFQITKWVLIVQHTHTHIYIHNYADIYTSKHHYLPKWTLLDGEQFNIQLQIQRICKSMNVQIEKSL